MSAAEWLSDTQKGIAQTVRPGQVRMAQLIEDVFANKGFAMIEGGTGTGKSFAYLIPAILSGKRIIVSTAKKALQKQLRDKDLPFLTERLGIPFTYASFKGKNNYVCKLRVNEFLESNNFVRYSTEDVNKFLEWSRQDEIAEMDDYEENIDFSQHIRVSECVVKHCNFADACGYRKAKSRAMMSKIVVVNHALLAFDLAMGSGKLLGKYDALIIDEAHQAPKFFREAHTCRIHNKQPEALRKLLEKTGLNPPADFEANIHDFLASLPERGRIKSNNISNEVVLKLMDNLLHLKRLFIQDGVWSEEGEEEQDSLREAAELSRLKAAVTMTKKMIIACSACMEESDNHVMYLETKTHKEFIVTPIEVGPLVYPALKHLETVVFTSATLATGGTFDYLCHDFGFHPEEVRIKEVMPPAFNYKANSCLYVSNATSIYERNARQTYWQTCTNIMHALFTASRGGAFVLCASYEDMNAFYERLIGLNNNVYRLRSQTGNVSALINWFKEDPTSVILGVKSIWEGVDIPGLGLRLIVIPRLPFPNPDDPIFTARKEKYVAAKIKAGTDPGVADRNSWQYYDLQEAIMEFKQGAGRLIRRETDKGVVAVLDGRLYTNTKRYAGLVRSSIPHPLTYDLEATKNFLRVLASRV